MIFEYLRLVRVYTKPKGAPRWAAAHERLLPRSGRRFSGCARVASRAGRRRPAPDSPCPSSTAGKLPDWQDPVVLRAGHSTVEDFCNKCALRLAFACCAVLPLC